MEKINISSLLSSQDDISFMINSYQELLSRNIGFADLVEHLILLKKGMTRKAMLYCIIRSPEFNNRLDIPELPSLKAAYFLYLLKRPFSASKQKSIKEDSTLPKLAKAESMSEYPLYYGCSQLEFEYLSSCQISVLSSLILPYVAAQNYYYSGHLALPLLHEAGIRCAAEFAVSGFPIKNIVKMGSCFFTDPALIHYMLTENHIFSFAHQLKDIFIFTMPSVLLAKDNTFSVIWDCRWQSLETKFGTSKWLVSSENHASIGIFNPSGNVKKVTLKYTLLSFENTSEVQVSFNNSSEHAYSFESCYQIEVCETVYLRPFYNKLSFCYIGSGVRSLPQNVTSTKFAVQSLSIASQEFIDSPSSRMPDALDFQYVLPDNYIRYILHNNGFFEVSAYQIFDNYDYHLLPDTRYDYLSTQSNGDGYYILNKNESLQNKRGIILYIAKRKGDKNSTQKSEMEAL